MKRSLIIIAAMAALAGCSPSPQTYQQAPQAPVVYQQVPQPQIVYQQAPQPVIVQQDHTAGAFIAGAVVGNLLSNSGSNRGVDTHTVVERHTTVIKEVAPAQAAAPIAAPARPSFVTPAAQPPKPTYAAPSRPSFAGPSSYKAPTMTVRPATTITIRNKR